MKPAPLPPIPTPWSQRLREWRLRFTPGLMTAAAIVCIAVLWRERISTPQFSGQAEPVLANLASYKPGTVAQLDVVRFQKVRAGDVLGKVLVADPKLVEASVALVRAELENIQASLAPLVQQQRNAVNYAGLRLDWMRERAELASARVDLQLAETEFLRVEELFKHQLVSASERDQVQAQRDALQQEVATLERLVTEAEAGFAHLQPVGTNQLLELTDDPMRTAIAAEEARLRLTEAELEPVLLRAPMDGIITAIFHRTGESVVAGDPVLTIASEQPVRIIGYLRQPHLDLAKVGMKVLVRMRNSPRSSALAQITAVGSQLETPPLPIAPPLNPEADLALPVEVSVPASLPLRPGELVDLALILKEK
ncbi:MAG: HlyD family efflux transporter periplasmic adaptor subunit [Verrucomicrobia bacterium]|nr:HlyD family efflux transporter periplasmic adaptor subunit [Verrucomicrobiota bacterium]